MSNENGKTKEEWKGKSDELNDSAAQFRKMGGPRDEVGKVQYLKVADEVEDFKSAYGAKEKALVGSKIAGKSLVNIKRFVIGTALPTMFEQASKKAKDRSK